MENENPIPRLRGNTFFLLLLRAARQEMSRVDVFQGASRGLTQSQLFAALMRTVRPTYTVKVESTLQQYLSQYLEGERIDSNAYYPFLSRAFRSSVELYVQEHYSEAVASMDELCREFLDVEDDATVRLLAGGLIALILKDTSIPPDTLFDTGYRSVSRAELNGEENFILQPFLLSVWAYIVINKPNAKEGAETYFGWTKSTGKGRPRRISTNWGASKAKKIAVSLDFSGAGEPTNTAAEDNDEFEVLKEDFGTEEGPVPDGAAGRVPVNQGRIYQQQAEKIINIEHVDVLNL